MSGKTLTDFKAKFDKTQAIENRIRAAIEDLAKNGPENWAPELEFCRRYKLSTKTLAEHRDKFAKWTVAVSTDSRKVNRVWFATEKAAAAARKLIEAQECQVAL